MGGTTFTDVGYGRTPEDAFHDAREAAQWEHGHGGYTGTIAEKGSYVLFVLPPRTDPFKVERAVYGAGNALGREQETEPVFYGAHIDKAQVRKWQAQDRRDLKWLRERLGEREARRLIEVADGSKWGPAACIEVKGKKATEMKERRGLKGTHNKVYLFFGWASC